MNIKLIFHLMPWELDFSELAFEKLSVAKKYLSVEDKVYVHSALNLSDYIINWDDSKLPKQFFIEKYNNSLNHLCEYSVMSNIYDKSELYGHLDVQRESIQSDIDYYIYICPDMYFHNHLLFYLIESAKKIKDKYFIITSETTQLWDYTWDEMVNKNFNHVNYKDWNKQSAAEVIHFIDNNEEPPSLEKMNLFKYAGWFDLYNKNFYEKFMPVFDEWHGYGPWDFFGMNVASFAKKQHGTNIEQYILRNQIIFERNIGVFENKLSSNLYRKYLKLNDIPNQRKNFESNFQQYFTKWRDYAIKNNIL